MATVVNPGESVVMDCRAYAAWNPFEGSAQRHSPICRGDIVTYWDAPSWGRRWNRRFRVGRVVGMPGEIVRVEQGRVFINNRLLDPYAIYDFVGDGPQPKPGQYYLPRYLSEGQYFILNDARWFADDSRMVGPVEEEKILGKAVRIHWSPNWGRIGKRIAY